MAYKAHIQMVDDGDSPIHEQILPDAPFIGFSHCGVSIWNPFYDETMRESVEPDYYGFELDNFGGGDRGWSRSVADDPDFEGDGHLALTALDPADYPPSCDCKGWMMQYVDPDSEFGTHPMWQVEYFPKVKGANVRVTWWTEEKPGTEPVPGPEMEEEYDEDDPFLLAYVAIDEMNLLQMEKLHFHLGEVIETERAKRDLESDIRMVAEAAQEAFWAVVARKFTEIKTGDLDIGASVEFTDACRRVVGLWVETNTPEED